MRKCIHAGIAGLVACVLTLAAAPAAAQGVDYHRAQQAGKVWRDRADENNRRDAAAGKRRTNSAGVAYDAPLTAADRAAALAANRADYQRLHDSVGKKNADRWLDFKARAARAAR